MSWHECPAAQARPAPAPSDPVELVLVPRSRDLGGFEVRRALPSGRRRAVGPFVFLDQMGPSVMGAGHGLDVRPHPHIGLATLTYLFRGEILHRDSLGSVQAIRPGEVNWMIAGRGIVHSERTPAELRGHDHELFGLQAWIALPQAEEETAPAFVHYPATALPGLEGDGWVLRVIVGDWLGHRSPVPTFGETLYVDIELAAGAVFPLRGGPEERALYLVEGALDIAGRRHEAGRLLVIHAGDTVELQADTPARVVLLGGEPLDGPRFLWWNFVSSRKERIEQAKADWRAGRFPAVPDDDEAIPLPDTPGP